MFMGVVMACFIIFLNHLPFNWVNLFELTAEISLTVFVFSLFINEAIPKAAWMGAYLDGCKKAWIPCFIVSYIASFAAVALGKKVAQKYVK